MNSNLFSCKGVWFVYDGQCPICSHAVHAIKIKEKYGALHLLDARQDNTHILIKEINQHQLDLDEGMVIYYQDKFYHGKDALMFMAQFNDSNGIISIVSKHLFKYKIMSSLFYPWFKGVRNYMLRLKNVENIDNLNLTNEPIFKPVFGDSWHKLPISLKKHYAIFPYSSNKIFVKGCLDIEYHWIINILRPIYRLMGNVPIQRGKNIHTTVYFESDRNSKAFHFKREFHFQDAKPYKFRSYMLQLTGNRVIEVMRFGFCWKVQFLFKNNKVILKHHGYAFKLFKLFIPLPLSYIIGRGDAEEISINDNIFAMKVKVTHPIFGEIYSYAGQFEFVN